MKEQEKTEITEEGIKETIHALFEAFRPADRNLPYLGYRLNDARKILSMFYDKYFSKMEGTAFSHDKSQYVSGKIIQSIKDDVNYELQETYDIEKYPQMKEYEGQSAYWCPKTIKDTSDAINIFLSHLLSFGKPTDDTEQAIGGSNGYHEEVTA
jgi:hypothetical protein